MVQEIRRPDADGAGLLPTATGDVKPRGDAGAPAALRAIEEHEVRCREEKEIARDLWKAAQTNLCEGDEVSGRTESRTRQDYLHALEIWDDATKKLALFDKTVAPEKREGEKVTKADAEKWLTSFARHARVGFEMMIGAVAQDAMQCATPEDFYRMSAEQFRGSFNEAMNTAERENQLPSWAAMAVKAGL